MDDNERTMIGGGAKPQSALELPETLRIYLSFTKGPLTGQRIRLSRSVITVGRKSPAEIIVSDPTVSGSHARFEIINEEVTLFDCESTNGTFVSGQKVTKSAVNNMDEVGFGDTRALLTVVNDPYGLYSDDFESTDATAEKTSDSITTPPFERCLLAGYNPQNKALLDGLMNQKLLAKDFLSANHGGEFIEVATIAFREKKPIDLIITEIRMQLINGVQALVAFRHLEKAFEIKDSAPIVIFSEMNKDANLDKAIEYLKPAKYLQAARDPAEFQRRADALVERLKQLGHKRKG